MRSQSVWKIATIISTLHFTHAWRLVCFKGSLSNSYSVTVENASLLITSGYMDINKRTMMCAHGYGGTLYTQGNQGINLILEACLLSGLYNCCGVDYSKEAATGPIPVMYYPKAVIVAAYVVAWELAQLLNKLRLLGFDVNTLHMICHSLGAHLCGNAARMTGTTIYRITGLDPAGPGFGSNIPIYPPFLRLSKEDAGFVDSVHTDKNGYGMPDATAHQDFFPCPYQYDKNGVQPGCPPKSSAMIDLSTLPGMGKEHMEGIGGGLYPAVGQYRLIMATYKCNCSHHRSVDLCIDDFYMPCQMLATKAGSEDEFMKPGFVPNIITCFGEYTNQTFSGKFYFRTNDQSPFGLGLLGLTAQ